MATISFTTKFNLTLTPKQFVFTDTADYPGQGIALANVNGCFKITAPSGTVIYNNTDFSNAGCDIRASVSLSGQQTIALPLAVDGSVEEGAYEIVYTVYDNNLLVYSTVTNEYSYEYTTPTVSIEKTINCFSPLLTSTDATDYVVGGVTPSMSRTHTINYPVGTAGFASPTTGSSTTVTTSTFYPGTQTTEIENTLTYTFSDGLIVIDSVEGTLEYVVDCTYICALYCCVKSMFDQVETYRTTNSVEYNKLLPKFNQVIGIIALAKLAIECGETDDVSAYTELVYTLTNCTSDCECSEDSLAPIVGLGGLVGSYVVTSGGSPIIVTANTVGATTTFTVTLSPAFVTTVNSLYNTVVAAGAGITVTGPVIAGLLHTFTVSTTATVVSNQEASESLVIDDPGNNQNLEIDILSPVTIVDQDVYEVHAMIDNVTIDYPTPDSTNGSLFFRLKKDAATVAFASLSLHGAYGVPVSVEQSLNIFWSGSCTPAQVLKLVVFYETVTGLKTDEVITFDTGKWRLLVKKLR